MSTLFVNTIYPDSGSSVNISGSLIISQSLIVADDITMSGSIKLGDANTDSVSLTAEISSSIIPDADLTYNLGSSAKKWNKLHVGNITASHNISSSGTVFGAIGKFDELELPPFTSITASGGITASAFFGDGSNLTGVGTTGSVLDVVSVSVDTFVSGAGTGSFNHFFVSGEISGSVSASGTGSFQGGVVATGATGSFGYVTAPEISASGEIYVDSTGGNSANVTIKDSSTNFVKMGIDALNRSYIGWDDSDTLQFGGLTSTSDPYITSTFSIFANGSVSGSGTGSFKSLQVASGEVDFTNLPKANNTSGAGSGTSTGQLFTVSGSQLPFSGSTSELNAVSGALFVMIKQ